MNPQRSPKDKVGFWDRLVRFVRHPTTDWAQTRFQPGTSRSKAAEKAEQRYIQRQQRGAALIRDQEFEVLRRALRNRKARSAAQLEGISMSSTMPPPLRPVSRLHTLHKINAIEKQIQTEQRRQTQTTLIASVPTYPHEAGASTLRPGTHRRSAPRRGYGEARPSRPALIPPPSLLRHTLPPLDWDPPKLPVPAVVELAAFDFAEGRDAAVESQLLTGLQTEPGFSTVEQIFQALLDFYWATRQDDKFQSRLLDYVGRYGQTPAPRPELGLSGNAQKPTASFIAVDEFDVLQLRAFERFVTEPARHLMLDWSALVSVPAAQRERLAKALQTLNGRTGVLELRGLDALLQATRLSSKPWDPAEAALRLQVLRLAQDEAGFIDLAVELAVQNAQSPIDWTPPAFEHAGAESGQTSLAFTQHPAQESIQLGHGEGGFVQTTVRLSGSLSGADLSFMHALRQQSGHADIITVELHAVQRVDFAAATDLLNWIEAQKRLGKTVEWRGAHTLLVPFLQSVGLQPLG